MDRVFNFSAGTAMLPKEVLDRARAEMLSYGRSGSSIMELSSDSPELAEILQSTEDALRRLLSIPANYKILFLQGGSAAQFSAVPLNLLSERRCADYIISGKQSKVAYTEAKRYGDMVIAASSGAASPTFSTIPVTKRSDFRPDADYVHICYNNTLYGTKYHYIPDTGNIPLVADMSSCLCSEPVDVSKFGMIYADLQQNIAPVGLTAVVVRSDLMGNTRPDTPSTLNYKRILGDDDVNCTPPGWALYLAGLVFEWIISIGGLDEMKRRNERKASLLYDYLDGQTYFTAPVDKKCRSMMNVVFYIGDARLDKKFCDEAAAEGLINLIAPQQIGGMCASMYNAMPYEGVERLVAFMKSFAASNPKIQR